MRSIQARLIVWCALAAIMLSGGTGLLLYRSMQADLVREFDRSLLSRAQALSTLLTVDERGKLDFEYTEQSMPEFQAHRSAGERHAAYFIFRWGDGRVYATSGSLAGKRLPVLGTNEESGDLVLPSGVMGRAVRLRFVPARDPETLEHARESDENEPPRADGMAVRAENENRAHEPGVMTLLIARERSGLDRSLARLVRVLALASALLAGVLAGVCALIVRISLRPLREMTDAMSRIEPSNLDERIALRRLPKELQPIRGRLNDLLDRLERAFVRERRFTSDVAHELRTPIAELRSITDVALRWPDDRPGAIEALRDSREIAMQLQTLVTTLLALVRSERSQEKALHCRGMVLREAVERIVGESTGAGEAPVEIEIPPDARVHAEPTLLASILRNLLCNAREYADRSAPIRCSARPDDSDWVLCIENRAQNLSALDLPHLFEPFWRKDSARSDSAHAGLGLSLVRAYCGLMGGRIDAELSDDRMLRMGVRLPADRSCSDHVRGDNFVAPARAVRAEETV